METLQFLIKKIIITIPIIFLVGLIYFVFIKYSPNFSFGKVNGSLSDLLPDPRLTPEIKPYVLNSPDLKINGTVVGVNQNRTGGASYMTVDKNGNLVYYKLSPNTTQNNTLFNLNQGTKKYTDTDYVRNLSIFSNGHIYTGLTFTGEAKNTMFKNGVFQVLVVDRFGRIISADNITTSPSNWSMPGWVRFYGKLSGVLPVNTPCSIIFRPAQGAPDSANGIYVSVPEICN